MPYDSRPWLKWYDDGIPSDVVTPDISLVDHFNDVASKVALRPAVFFLGTALTYADLMSAANSVANALIEAGCGTGDVVAINLPNIPQYLIAQLGVMKAGCAASGLSPLLTPREMAHQLTDSGAKGLVTLDAIFEHKFAGIANQVPDLKFVAVTGILDYVSPIKRTLAKLLKKVPTGKVRSLSGKIVLKYKDILTRYPSRDPGVKVLSHDRCLIQYTGGTTGVPKGTILTHRNMFAELAFVTEWLQMKWGEEVILSGFPFFHIAGLALGLGSIFQGHSQILIPDPRNTKHILKEMARYRPTMLVNVPSLYMMLLEEPGFHSLDFSRLGFCLSAASPFPAESLKQLESVVGEGKVVEAYGLTEGCALVTCNPRRGTKKVGSVGLPLQNTTIRLVDIETGEHQVPVGEEGEIIVSAPQVMKCYLNKPQETSLALREYDGKVWLHTGDVARMDEDGFFTIVDRSKDMLNVGGFKVFSREVEDKMYEHPAIEFCAIIGISNPKRPGTDIVKLVVQLKQAFKDRDQEKLKEDLLGYARDNFAPYKLPKIIEILDAMPLTSVGKVDKKALRMKDGVASANPGS
ncbi:MAG: AMP-binding protein [Desulfomonilaceae bacterium]